MNVIDLLKDFHCFYQNGGEETAMLGHATLYSTPLTLFILSE